MKPFNLQEAIYGRPVMTRSGLPVRVLCTNKKGTSRVVVLIQQPKGDETVGVYDDRGKMSTQESPTDLVMVPIKKKQFVALYKTSNGCVTSICSSSRKGLDEFFQSRSREPLVIQEIEYEV